MELFSPKTLPTAEYPVPWGNSLRQLIGEVTLDVKTIRSSIPNQWLGLVSSHSSKLNFASLPWQTSLQSALLLSTQQRWGILFAADTPYAAAIVHACDRLDIPWMDITDSSATSTGRNRSGRIKGYCGTICVSSTQQNSDTLKDLLGTPLHDRAVAFLSDRLFAIEVRLGGKIANLIRTRLQHSEIPSATTYISLAAVPNGPKFLNSVDDPLALGAIGWIANDSKSTNQRNTNVYTTEFGNCTYQPIMAFEALQKSFKKWLCHCTRARCGPWPDQSLEQFHDEILQSPWDHAPTSFESLRRILCQKRLIGTNQFRRGSLKTVCFSERPIDQLLSMRRFQSHIARWDWEPYGILIDRQWLVEQGAKAVRYVPANEAKKLNREELPFVQVLGNKYNSIDWSNEQVWRIGGDIRLNLIPSSKAFVFVPTLDEAREIQSISRWPVLVTGNTRLKT